MQTFFNTHRPKSIFYGVNAEKEFPNTTYPNKKIFGKKMLGHSVEILL